MPISTYDSSNMSWFQTTSFANLAKTALKEAQKTIDKALDIKEENSAAKLPVDPDPDVALTESEILASHGSGEEEITNSCLLEEVADLDVVDDSHVYASNLDSASMNLSVPDSIAPGESDSNWSTIEIETVNASHSRNSSISTLPDSNSTSSPERDLERSRPVYVNEGTVQLSPAEEDDVSPLSPSTHGILTNIVLTSEDSGEKTEICSASASTGADVKTMIENDVELQSSSSFEHVSTPTDQLGNSCHSGRNTSPGSNILSQSHISGNNNKFVAKIKTTASSASSSDIEVIPLDPEDQTISKVFQDAESQTEDLASVHTKEKPKLSNGKTDESLTKVTATLEEKIREKDREIEQLRKEGEKLSKKQYDISNVIKKLRAKEKDTESTIKSLKTELCDKCAELERLMKVFVNKEATEQAQQEQIGKLNAENRKHEVEIERLKSELEDAVENCNSMKISVENTSLEILEAKNIILATQRDATEVDQLKRDKSELVSCNDLLQKEVDRLRSVVNDSQKDFSRREQELKSQLVAVTANCHQLENKLSDIASDVADATMPLSLEIDKLQQELKSNEALSQRREQTLIARANDLEQKLDGCEDRENSFAVLEESYQSSLNAAELKIKQLEQENTRLRNSLQQESLKIERLTGDFESRLQVSQTETDRLIAEKEELEVELRNEQCERKKIQQLREQQLHSNTGRMLPVPNQSDDHGMVPSSNTASSASSVASVSGSTVTQHQHKQNPGQHSGENSPSSHSVLSEVSYLDEVFDPHGQNIRSMTPKSFFESFSSANVIENLHSQLRLREGELVQLQDDSGKNEKIRKTLNEEIAQLTLQNQELLLQMETLSDIQSRLEEVERKYNTVLQLYGEKVEEAEELRLDLQDVKKMYTEQIDKLFER